MANLEVSIVLAAINNASGVIGAVESALSRLTSTVGTSASGFGAHATAATASEGALGGLNTKAAASFEEISRLSDANFTAAGYTTQHAAAATTAEHALGQLGTTAGAGAGALNQHAAAAQASGSAMGQHAGATNNAEQAMSHMNTTAQQSTGVFGQLRDLAVQGFGLSVGWQAFQGVSSAIESVIPSAAHFETTLNQVKQNTGLAADKMDILKQGVLELSRESGVGTDAISQGWMHVMNVTQNASDATGILKVALQSAVSTGGNVSDTADVLARAMHEYGLDTSSSSRALTKVLR